MKIRFWAIPACIIAAAGLLFALSVRGSYTHLPQSEILEYRYRTSQLSGIYELDIPIQDVTLDFLLEEADVAVVATYTGESRYSTDTAQWKMAVNTVLKGENVGDSLLFIDRNVLFFDSECASTGLFNCRTPLIKGHTYLLLLHPLDYPVSPEGLGQYYPIYLSALGCLDLSRTAPSTPFPDDPDHPWTLADILGSSIATTSAEDCALYDALVAEARRRLA